MASAAHGTAADFHGYEQGVEGNHPEHQPGTQANDFRVRGEDPEDEVAAKNDDGTAGSDERNAHDQTDPDALVDPVIFLSAVILTDEGGDGHAQGTGNHPGQHIRLCVSRKSRDGGGAEGIDTGLDQKIGQIKGDELQTGR